MQLAELMQQQCKLHYDGECHPDEPMFLFHMTGCIRYAMDDVSDQPDTEKYTISASKPIVQSSVDCGRGSEDGAQHQQTPGLLVRTLSSGL
jgi:hypothetical protein